MLEYARCTNLSGDAVVKSFDGKSFTNEITSKDVSAKRSLKKLQGQGIAKR